MCTNESNKRLYSHIPYSRLPRLSVVTRGFFAKRLRQRTNALADGVGGSVGTRVFGKRLHQRTNAASARVARPSGAPGRPSRWPWPSEKRGWRWIDLLEACQLLGACRVGIRRGHQSGRSAPTLNTLSCSVTSTEPACAMALQETAARRFCDCQHVRRPPRLAVMLGLRHGGRELLRGLQG